MFKKTFFLYIVNFNTFNYLKVIRLMYFVKFKIQCRIKVALLDRILHYIEDTIFVKKAQRKRKNLKILKLTKFQFFYYS